MTSEKKFLEDRIRQLEEAVLPDAPKGYRLGLEQSKSGMWTARLLTSVQFTKCIKGYGTSPRAAALSAIAKIPVDVA